MTRRRILVVPILLAITALSAQASVVSTGPPMVQQGTQTALNLVASPATQAQAAAPHYLSATSMAHKDFVRVVASSNVAQVPSMQVFTSLARAPAHHRCQNFLRQDAGWVIASSQGARFISVRRHSRGERCCLHSAELVLYE